MELVVVSVVFVVTVDVVVSAVVMDGDCVTVTLEDDFCGTMLTLVFRPVAEPLPAAPTELEV